jgi:hypothetical protein
MTHKSKIQPYCRMCGKAIKKRTGIVNLQHPESVTLLHMGGEFWRHVAGNATTKAECQRYTNHKVVSISRRPDGSIRSFSEWDGESYVDPFFCNGSCCKDYAYMMAYAYPDVVSKTYIEKARKRGEKMRRGSMTEKRRPATRGRPPGALSQG